MIKSELIDRTRNGPRLNSLNYPTSATYDLTLSCNLNCKFCYQGKSPKTGHPSLTTVKKILDELKRGGIRKVIFVGGEPFMHPDLIETLSYASELGFISSFVSNGTLITKKTVKSISGFLSEGLISIHGDEETHDYLTSTDGSYRKAVAGLGILSENGFKMGVYYTLTEVNHSKIYATLKDLVEDRKVGFKWLALNRDLPQGIGSDYFKDPLSLRDYHRIFQQLEKIEDAYGLLTFLEVAFPLCLVHKKYHRYILTCRVGVSHTAIDPHGNMKLCPVMNEYNLGNILDQGLPNLWRNSPVLEEYRSLEWLSEGCRNCGYLGKCLGGCLAASKTKKMSPLFSKERQ